MHFLLEIADAFRFAGGTEMANFKYYTPTKVLFGRGQDEHVAELLREYGANRVLIHYGSDRVIENGLMGKVIAKLDEAGIDHRTACFCTLNGLPNLLEH